MTIEQHIRKSLGHYAHSIDVPSELDAAVARHLNKRYRGRRTTPFRRAVLVALISVFAVTATAFAASPELADRIYGSFAELKKTVVTVTMLEYQKLGMKLGGAKKTLGEDYPAFEQQLKQVVAAKVEYANKHYQIDFLALPPETYAELKMLYAEIQPYFDQLNGQPIAQEVLSAEQYDRYMEAQLQRESILAQSGVNPSDGPVEPGELPVELQPAYKEAQQTIFELEESMNKGK
ncbi:DUF3600 domain-containing protein [Paenibacillus sp. JSM ZJ436]|uniref:DUF3600 domain-containing protein n=1 Tax=Paenibacillus sp. JSM ZJ436 TaxID=3376190 RepID=UPI0037AD1BDA